jgi:hypothetical protein
MPTRITSMEQLKTESEQGAEFFILLNHGLRSSKDIVWDAQARKFHIFNHIDQTEQHLTERQLMDEGSVTNVGYAKLECRDRMRRCMKHEEERPVKITPWRKERKALLPIPVCEYSR